MAFLPQPAPRIVSTGSVSKPTGIGGHRYGPPGANTRNIVATSASRTIGTVNAAVTVTADAAGVDGNDITFAIVVAGNNTSISVAVTDTDIVLNAATDGGGLSTTTATAAAAALQGDVDAAALITATAGGTGASVVVAGAEGALTGGVDRHFGT